LEETGENFDWAGEGARSGSVSFTFTSSSTSTWKLMPFIAFSKNFSNFTNIEVTDFVVGWLEERVNWQHIWRKSVANEFVDVYRPLLSLFWMDTRERSEGSFL